MKHGRLTRFEGVVASTGPLYFPGCEFYSKQDFIS